MKYSPRGGTVRVSARADGGQAVVEVADEGVGIPEGDGVDLFAPFSQAGDTNTREYGGVGLGLYIVRQLVEAQGGTVAAANRPGGGAVVSFTLPLTTAPLAVDGAPVGYAAASPEGVRYAASSMMPPVMPSTMPATSSTPPTIASGMLCSTKAKPRTIVASVMSADGDPRAALVLVGGVGLAGVSEIGHGRVLRVVVWQLGPEPTGGTSPAGRGCHLP